MINIQLPTFWRIDNYELLKSLFILENWLSLINTWDYQHFKYFKSKILLLKQLYPNIDIYKFEFFDSKRSLLLCLEKLNRSLCNSNLK